MEFHPLPDEISCRSSGGTTASLLKAPQATCLKIADGHRWPFENREYQD